MSAAFPDVVPAELSDGGASRAARWRRPVPKEKLYAGYDDRAIASD